MPYKDIDYSTCKKVAWKKKKLIIDEKDTQKAKLI
jgi:hypothetical protein